MIRNLTIGIVLALAACAANHEQIALVTKGDPQHPLYVGTSQGGEIVVAANHADAMNGLAIAAAEIGAKGDEALLCKRELLTGTHVPKWYCRFPSEVEKQRMETQNWLSQPHNCTTCRPDAR